MTSLENFNPHGKWSPTYEETYSWGFFKIPNRIFDCALMRNPNAYTVWGWLQSHALIPKNVGRLSVVIDGETIWLEADQLVSGINKIEEETGVKAKTAWRMLRKFEAANLIEIRSTNQFSLITLKNSFLYQRHENRIANQKRIEGETGENFIKKSKEAKETVDNGLRKKIIEWFSKPNYEIGNPQQYLQAILAKGAIQEDLKRAWGDLERGNLNAHPSQFYTRAVEYSKLRIRMAYQKRHSDH